MTNADLYKNVSITGVPLVPTDPAFPCGIVAYTFFNDTFSILYPDANNVSMTTEGIAWPSDVSRFVAYN